MISMASKLAILSLFVFALAIGFGVIRADESVDFGSGGPDSTALKVELEQLKSKIHALESLIEEKAKELRTKDEVIAGKEKIIKEKLDKVASLQDEMSSIQNKGKLDAAEEIGKANAWASELEKQVEKLRSELVIQGKAKEDMELRESEAEKKTQELTGKLLDLRRVSDEQKSRIRKLERALKVAEEELMKAKSEAASKIKELIEVHQAWLPPWLAPHLVRCQAFIETHWNEHGRPAINLIIQKATEKSSEFVKWAGPHMEIIKTEWIPTIKEHCLVIKACLEPHVHSFNKKTIEFYEASKTAVTPHVSKAQEFIDPYFQEVKKFSKPYIDEVATVAKPHVDKLRVTLKPYTEKVVHAYGNFLELATSYHHQVQGYIREMLKRHELTRPLATKELEWFAASALLALPIIILSRFCTAIFWKPNRPARNTQRHHHARRKAKRGHPEK